MTKWDLILEWMTHLGSGMWGSFLQAVAELGDDDMDERAVARTLRIGLSNFGHVDFFVDGSKRWNVLRPALVQLPGSCENLFVGGRTRVLYEELCKVASTHATVTVTEINPGLSRVSVIGDPESLAATARSIGIDYIVDAAAKLSGCVPSIRSVLDAGQPVQEPINWSIRSWSFKENGWVNEKLPRTVREYTNRHGVRRYLVHAGKSGLREIEKRASVYCAAFLTGVRVAHYSQEERLLRVPRWAPLPQAYARAACLASGKLGALSGDDIVFENMDVRVASMLLVGLGQGFPMPRIKR